MSLRYLSVCSGIEAASVAWGNLGWTPVAFSEIDPFPRAVLAHRFPKVPLHGDFTTIGPNDYGTIDLLVGGTPCQSFSVAGLRGGLDDERGNLALEYLRLADRKRPRWLVWENVPGVLSSNGGRDFGSILGGMVELGYGIAYRVLDAQFFGVAQRRRRVFVVGYLGDWRRAAAVLFERHSLQGHPAPRREKGQGAPTIPSRRSAGGGLGTDFDCDGGLIHAPVVSPALKARDYKGPSSDGDGDGAPLIAHALRAEGFDASEDGTGRGTPLVPVAFMSNASGANLTVGHDLSPTLRIGGDGGNAMAVAFALRGREGGAMPEMEGEQTGALRAANGGSSRSYVAFDTTQVTSRLNRSTPQPGDPCHPLAAGAHAPAVAGLSAVRRLTPVECERLQGFPDGWTDIPWRGKPTAPDGPRYKALGNSMAVPVMRWIGKRIAAVEAPQ